MRWENRCKTLQVLLAIAALLAVPHLSSLLGKELLRPAMAPLDWLLGIHRYREVTGYMGLSLVVVALSVSLRPNTRLPCLRRKYRVVHIVVGLLLLLMVLLHTGGTYGTHLNGFLLGSLELAIFIALAGKLLENRRLESGAGVGRVRALWLPAHLLAVALLLAFLVFHVFSVYYF